VAFSSMAWNTSSSSPGELEMTRNTSEVAVCCSSASERCPRASASSRLHASSSSPRSVRGLITGPTGVVAFIPVERLLRPCVRFFAPLRAKITSSARSLVLCWLPKLRKPSNREHNTLDLLCEIVHTTGPNDQTSLPTTYEARHVRSNGAAFGSLARTRQFLVQTL